MCEKHNRRHDDTVVNWSAVIVIVALIAVWAGVYFAVTH